MRVGNKWIKWKKMYNEQSQLMFILYLLYLHHTSPAADLTLSLTMSDVDFLHSIFTAEVK